MTERTVCKGLGPRLRGERGLGKHRVIARREAPKQPRGSSAKVRGNLLGCFAALAMTQVRKALSPLEGERVGSGGGCSSTGRSANSWFQRAAYRLSVKVWVSACAGNAGEGNKALTQPSPTGRGLRTMRKALAPLGERVG
jgi:hypothetical protein